MKLLKLLSLCLSFTFIVVKPGHGFSLSESMPTKQLIELAKSVQPDIYKNFEKKFLDLAQMCRHANNYRFPSSQMDTLEPTPKLSPGGLMTREKALKQQHTLNKLGSDLMKAFQSLKAKTEQALVVPSCQHSLFNLSPEKIIQAKLQTEFVQLEVILQQENFKGCAQFIEGRLK